MKTAAGFLLVLVTAPNLKTARAIARAALTAKLIACANLIPAVESHYWWQGKTQSAREVLLILKTSRALLPKLEKLILSLHPYDTPEILTLAPGLGTSKYLAWMSGCLVRSNPGR
jgi:periplasmic divalent cation tolerance protein